MPVSLAVLGRQPPIPSGSSPSRRFFSRSFSPANPNMDRRTIYVRDKTPSLGDSSSNSPDNASLSSSSKMPPNHSRGVPRSLWDATGYGFIEEFGEYVSRFIASPAYGYAPTPSPPSGRGDVLRYGARSTAHFSDCRGILSCPLPRLTAGLAPSRPRGRKFCGSLSNDFHSLGAGASASVCASALVCASFLSSVLGGFVPPCNSGRGFKLRSNIEVA